MSEEATHEKLLDRVRKLVALACDDRAPEPERDAAMSLAQALMTKHAIDEARLGAVGQHDRASRQPRLHDAGSVQQSQGVRVLARRLRSRPEDRHPPRVAGSRASTSGGCTSSATSPTSSSSTSSSASLMIQMTRDCAQAYDGTGQIFWTSFITAFCNAVGHRLHEARKAADRGAGRRARHRHRAGRSHRVHHGRPTRRLPGTAQGHIGPHRRIRNRRRTRFRSPSRPRSDTNREQHPLAEAIAVGPALEPFISDCVGSGRDVRLEGCDERRRAARGVGATGSATCRSPCCATTCTRLTS